MPCKYRSLAYIVVVGVLTIVSVIAPAISEDHQQKDMVTVQEQSTVVDELRTITVDKSTPLAIAQVQQRTIKAMANAAATKRVDALVLLIKGLAYHRDLINANEPVDPINVFPAVLLIKQHYGSLALPYLYHEGITTDKPWLHKRCAFAIRQIATKDEISRYNDTFALKQTTLPGGKNLLTLLEAENLDATSIKEVYGDKALPFL